MAATTSFKRGFLRNAWAEAQAAGQTLTAKLNALNASAQSAVNGGVVLTGTSGNGRSAEFTVNASEGVTPTEVAELVSGLLDLYDAAVAAGNTTDATRFAYMMNALKPVRSFGSDFQRLRA